MNEWNLIPRTRQLLTRRASLETVFRLIFAGIILAEVAMLLWAGRRQWYFFDEWRLVIDRVVPHPHGALAQFRQLFRPDGEHIIGLPLFFFVILVRWFGIATYWPFVFVNIVVRVATLFVLDDVCRRVGARRIVRLLAVTVIAFFGEGYESLFGQSLMFAGFTLVFALLAIRSSLRTDVSERRAGIASAIWLSLSILSSSYGFPVVAGVALFYFLTRRRRAAAVSLLLPPIVFIGVRLICGGAYAQQQPISTARIPLYVHYVQLGLSAVGDAVTGMDGLGLVGFVGLVVISWLVVTDDRSRAIIVSLVVAIVLFYFEASLSRSVFGAEQARSATRYIFFCGVLMIIVLSAAWGQRRVDSRWATIVVVLVVVNLANSITWLGDGSAFFIDKMQLSRARIALGLEIVDSGLAFYAPDSQYAGDLAGDGLRAVMSSRYDDGFMAESRNCYQHWDLELSNAGVPDGSLTGEERAALLVLLNEHSFGVGDPTATLDDLVEQAVQNESSNLEIGQFISAYSELASHPVDAAGFVPTTARCT